MLTPRLVSLMACSAVAMTSVVLGARLDLPRDAAIDGQRYAMGTMFRVVARAEGAADGTRRAVDAALDEVVRLDGVLSHYDERSDLSRLARDGAGRFVVVHPDLYAVVTQALDVSRRSAGRFDVTVGPLVRLWQGAHAAGRRPADHELARASACVGYEKVTVRPPDSIQLQSECMALDLGAIGKGYAVDRAVDVLRARGVRHAVVNGGGSTMKAMGDAPDLDGWPVRAPTSDGTTKVTLLRDEALSTSEPHAEIVESGTRAPTSRHMTVTVVAGSAALADALSTALLLSTVDEGRAMLRDLDGVTATWTPAERALTR